MEQTTAIKIIAEVRSDFPTKFGIPRQSGLVPELEALVVFRPEYRIPEALRGIEGYSHLWLLWEFSDGSVYSPAGRPFVPMPSGFPACGCLPWSTTPNGVRCCGSPAPTSWTAPPFMM